VAASQRTHPRGLRRWIPMKEPLILALTALEMKGQVSTEQLRFCATLSSEIVVENSSHAASMV
jgi:hypothetical protein